MCLVICVLSVASDTLLLPPPHDLLALSYRSAEEVKQARELRDPIKILLERYALEGNLATKEELDVSTTCIWYRQFGFFVYLHDAHV